MSTPVEPTGDELKGAGMDLALQAVPDWFERAQVALGVLASSGMTFTAEDLVYLVGLPRPDEEADRNNAVGAAFSAAARRRIIQRVGFRNSGTARSHARTLAIWVGSA